MPKSWPRYSLMAVTSFGRNSSPTQLASLDELRESPTLVSSKCNDCSWCRLNVYLLHLTSTLVPQVASKCVAESGSSSVAGAPVRGVAAVEPARQVRCQTALRQHRSLHLQLCTFEI